MLIVLFWFILTGIYTGIFNVLFIRRQLNELKVMNNRWQDDKTDITFDIYGFQFFSCILFFKSKFYRIPIGLIFAGLIKYKIASSLFASVCVIKSHRIKKKPSVHILFSDSVSTHLFLLRTSFSACCVRRRHLSLWNRKLIIART